MKLTLIRTKFLPDTTLGELHVDGAFECYTCEDTYRNLAVEAKVPGKTAIPYGSYNVVITYSPRFKVAMPLLEEVPHFSGIRIHPGNTHEDTEGCILVGRKLRPTGVGDSRLAYNEVFATLRRELATGRKVTIEVTDVQSRA